MEDRLQNMMKLWDAHQGWQVGGDIYVAHKLMFHFALLVNPSESGYEQRYCYKDLDLMAKAMSEFLVSGKLRYWHKDHSNNNTVKGNLLFPPGAYHEDPAQAIGTVDWTVD